MQNAVYLQKEMAEVVLMRDLDRLIQMVGGENMTMHNVLMTIQVQALQVFTGMDTVPGKDIVN